MELTKKQTESVLSNFLEKENGLNPALNVVNWERDSELFVLVKRTY